MPHRNMEEPYKLVEGPSATPARRLSFLTGFAYVLAALYAAGAIAELHRVYVTFYLRADYRTFALENSSGFVLFFELMGIFAFFPGFPLFVIWTYLAHRRLTTHFAQDEISPHWLGIVGYLIPVAGLIVPYLFIREIADRYKSLADHPSTALAPFAERLVLLWWLLFIASSGLLLISIATVSSAQGATIESIRIVLSPCSLALQALLLLALDQVRRIAVARQKRGLTAG